LIRLRLPPNRLSQLKLRRKLLQYQSLSPLKHPQVMLQLRKLLQRHLPLNQLKTTSQLPSNQTIVTRSRPSGRFFVA
jgi:hypothetical protein